jgi:hypothetical protein
MPHSSHFLGAQLFALLHILLHCKILFFWIFSFLLLYSLLDLLKAFELVNIVDGHVRELSRLEQNHLGNGLIEFCRCWSLPNVRRMSGESWVMDSSSDVLFVERLSSLGIIAKDRSITSIFRWEKRF